MAEDANKPKLPRGAAGLAAMNADKPLAHVEAEAILARYESGETIAQIAEDLEVSHQALYRKLLVEHPENWKRYKAARALNDFEECRELLKSAPDGLTLGRARESARLAMWELERLAKPIYGQETQQVTVNIISGEQVQARITELEQQLGLNSETIIAQQ